MTQMEKLHSLELKIAVEIKRICRKHEIPYFLTAGSILGAVRHRGFIPWDDDMDIGMLRADYDRFLEVCEAELGDEFLLQTWDTDPDYPFSFAKVRLKGTHIVEGFSEKTDPQKNGLFVDIFPFDSVPEDVKEQKRQARRYFLCKRLLWIKKGMGSNMKKGPLKQRIKYYAFCVFAAFFSYDSIKAYFKKTQIKYNHLDTARVVTDGSYSYWKESILREWTTNLEPVQFETEQFLSYKASKEYLTYFYGDYMKLPPEEKRNRHELKQVDFGPYLFAE